VSNWIYLSDSQSFLDMDDVSTVEVFEDDVAITMKGAGYTPEASVAEEHGMKVPVVEYARPSHSYSGADMDTIIDYCRMRAVETRDEMHEWALSPAASSLRSKPDPEALLTRMSPPEKRELKRAAREKALEPEEA